MTPEPRSLRRLLTDWGDAVAGTGLPRPPVYHGPDVILQRLVEHSGQVEPGDCFVARVRPGSDGHPYIPMAVERGATVVVGSKPPPPLPAAVIYLQVADTAVANAWLAAAWHGFPGQELVVIGVTGTDGKTTTANILFDVLRHAGLAVGMLSTTHAAVGDVREPLALHVTTPEAPVVQAYLRRMVESGVTHCILESTSHGLHQERVGAIYFDVALVTNITHEHLDYHGSFDAYFAAKARLFENLHWSPPAGGRFPPAPAKLGARRTAVLNGDDTVYERLRAIGAPRQMVYGIEGDAPYTARDISTTARRTRLQLLLPGGPEAGLPVESRLVGYFNVYNMLAAAAAAHAVGVAPAAIAAGLSRVGGIVGRMERVDAGQPFSAIVDFAHTPYGLEQALRTSRRMLEEQAADGETGRLIAVFGSAGKRDVAKRRMMAEIAARLADRVVLTAEDPRTDSLTAILDAMAAGCRSQGMVEGQQFWRVPDRGQAIHFALAHAAAGDLVIICGKAHEQSMCFGTTEFPWNDIAATGTALEALLSGRPMPDLGLPTFDPDFRADGA